MWVWIDRSAQNVLSKHATTSEAKFWGCHPHVEGNAMMQRTDARARKHTSSAPNKQQTNNALVLI